MWVWASFSGPNWRGVGLDYVQWNHGSWWTSIPRNSCQHLLRIPVYRWKLYPFEAYGIISMSLLWICQNWLEMINGNSVCLRKYSTQVLKVKLTFAIVSAAKCEVFQNQLCCIVVISLFGLFLSKLLNSRSLERVLGHRCGQSSRGWEYDRSTEWESRGESPKETLEVNEQLINTLIYSRMH